MPLYIIIPMSIVAFLGMLLALWRWLIRGIEWEVFNRSVDVLISRLRQKLKDDPKNPRFIKTIWGSGYMFIGEEDD